MTHYNDPDDWEYRKEAYYDRHPDELDQVHCNQEMSLVETTVYGDDADGRRGVPLYVFVCPICEQELEMIG